MDTIGEKICCKYGDIDKGMPVFTDRIPAVGDAEEIMKEIKNCRKMATLKNFKYGLKKTDIMIVRTGKEQVERIDERVKQGTVLETDRDKYLGIAINTEGNLKDHIQELGQKSNIILSEINVIGEKSQMRAEEVRVKLKLFETCLMSAMLHGIEAWGRILTKEIDEIEKM